VTLELGARTPQGECFAQVSGGPVFLLAADDCAALEAPLVTRELYSGDDPISVDLAGTRYERHGPGWYAGKDRVSDKEAESLAELLRLLARPPAALAYGELPRARTRLVITWADGKQTTLLLASPELALEGRDVRYRMPEAACAAWPIICR
jgi:hypothetical protein